MPFMPGFALDWLVISAAILVCFAVGTGSWYRVATELQTDQNCESEQTTSSVAEDIGIVAAQLLYTLPSSNHGV